MLSFRRRLGGSYRERRSGLWHELGARSQARDSGTRYFYTAVQRLCIYLHNVAISVPKRARSVNVYAVATARLAVDSGTSSAPHARHWPNVHGTHIQLFNRRIPNYTI